MSWSLWIDIPVLYSVFFSGASKVQLASYIDHLWVVHEGETCTNVSVLICDEKYTDGPRYREAELRSALFYRQST